MLAASALTLSALSLDATTAGWIVAGSLAAAWMLAALIRRRSTRALAKRLAPDSSLETHEQQYPLLEPLACAILRREREFHAREGLLSERLAELERVLHTTPIAVLSLDHLQRILSANPAAERLLAFDERSARGRLLQDSVRQPGLNRAVTQALARGGSTSVELHLELDTPLEVQLSCEPLHIDEKPAGIVLSLVDVTRIRRLESMRSEFAANVSHELRTPITNIKGYVETLLTAGITDPAQSRRFLEIIHRNTARLSGIVEDILTLAFLEEPEAKHALVKEAAHAADIVAQVIEDLSVAASARRAHIVASADPAIIVHCNRPLLEQALMNLLSNAIKYSKEGATITVVATVEGASVRIAVIDNGLGIAAKHLPRIFERFYRVDPSRARSQGATGLGLAIVKHIAVSHGGSVEVTSQIGEGSCFSVLVPYASDALSEPNGNSKNRAS